MADSGKLNVILVGGGGREHALAWRLSQSPRLGKLFITHPENPGLAKLGTPVDVPVSVREAYRLVQFCEKNDVSLIVIGPEEPLAEGMADKLRSSTRMVFGPDQNGAQLEADKAWSKQLMRGASIPTGESRTFRDAGAAIEYMETRVDEDVLMSLRERLGKLRDGALRRSAADAAIRVALAVADRGSVLKPDLTLLRDTGIFEQPQNEAEFLVKIAGALRKPRPDLPVVKASGLAKGKGVIVPGTVLEGIDAIRRIMVERVFGDAGLQVVIEERLRGPEVSVMALTDGRSIYVLETAQDHKRLGDNDTGPNTGGMGAFCPSAHVDSALMSTIERDILVPTVDALKREGIDYRGVIYAGIMLTHAGPKVLEYNCRFGDPECQALMARLDCDLLEVMVATCQGRLHEVDLKWRAGASCCVVIASPGYPDKPRSGQTIEGLDEAERIEGAMVFHAGTKRDGKSIVTAGGRVLGVTGVGADLDEARRRAYAAADLIRFDGRVMRRDIGAGTIKRR